MKEASDSNVSKRYSAIKFRILIADILLSLGSLLIFWIFLSTPLSEAVSGGRFPFFVACFSYISIFLVFMYAVSFPLHLFSSFLVERKFNLSDRTFGSWAKDELKSLALSFVLYVLCAEVFYFVLRRFPDTWWIIAATLWLIFSMVLARFLPILILPLFYKYIPVEDEGLKKAIMDLSDKSKIPLTDVSQIDFSTKTKKANAALVGLGKTRKVVLADTLVSEFTKEEISSVVAHEFGHLKYGHIWQLLIFSGIVTYVSFFLLHRFADRIVSFTGASGIADLSLFPAIMVLMFLFGFIILPLQNFFSRILERQADRFALDVTGDPESFTGAMKRLADMNLAEMDPSFLKKIFFYDHPPIVERIAMAAKALTLKDEGSRMKD